MHRGAEKRRGTADQTSFYRHCSQSLCSELRIVVSAIRDPVIRLLRLHECGNSEYCSDRWTVSQRSSTCNVADTITISKAAVFTVGNAAAIDVIIISQQLSLSRMAIWLVLQLVATPQFDYRQRSQKRGVALKVAEKAPHRHRYYWPT